MSATEEPPPQGYPPNPGQEAGYEPGQAPPGQGAAPPGEGYAPPGQGYTPPGQGSAPPGQGYGAPGQGYGAPGQGYGAPGQGYAPPGQAYGPPGYGPPGPAYGGPGYQPTAFGPSGPRADFWSRFAAALLDWLVLLPVYLIADFLILRSTVVGVWGVEILVALGYFTYFEGSPSGQTIGKKVLGIRVVDFNTGGPIDYGRAAIRYLGSILSGWAILIGYLWMLWDREKQTWHDKFANAVVVPASAYPVQSWPG